MKDSRFQPQSLGMLLGLSEFVKDLSGDEIKSSFFTDACSSGSHWKLQV
jgi:hypothetical protein